MNNFQDDFSSQPSNVQPSLPTLLLEDQKALTNTKVLKFDSLVKFFNRFSNLRGVKKTNYAKYFLNIIFKCDRSPSFLYPIIRLLLPNEDKDRGNYGLKQKNLSKVIQESLNITKQDYLRLHHYKNPSFHKNGVGIGDFSLCVFDVVKSYCKQHSSLTINQVNQMLDSLASSSSNHIIIFRKIFTISTAQEIKWIIRIILKDLKISIKIDTVLNAFHADATDYFNLTNSLLQTCKKFENPAVSLDDDIKIFFPIRPMLAGKKKITYFNESANKRLYYAETKFDGQRLQAHKKFKEVKLFSRNAVDYSKLYEQFITVINTHIDADQCIIDGEIIVIERHTLKMTAFGMNKMVALNKNTDQYRLCYNVFDVLWLKVEDQEINLMKYPLKQRKEILKKIVKEQPGVIQVVKFQEITDYDDILKRFSESIDRNEQGIMLKDPNSLYLPKERGASWVKLKGDYVDGLTDTLDLIILGGYFGDSSARYGPSKHWIDQITSFLVGVIDRIDPINSQIAYAVPFAKVGTGYSMEELNHLRQRLRDNLSKNEMKFKAPYLSCNWKPALQDKPDCWINSLSKSIVLQVKAAEMITSQSYPTGYTLRFPRVVKIRYDKDWNEAQTLNDIQDLSNSSLYSKNLKRKLDDSESDEDKSRQKEADEKPTKKVKKQRGGRKLEVYEQYMGFNMQNQKLLSHLFSNFQFCVFQFDNPSIKKAEIQREIMLHDGIVVQNPLPSTQYIVTQSIDFKLRAYQTQKDKNYTFIKPNYIKNCINASKILNLSPIYLTVLPQGNSKYYRDNFDRFGDSYTDYLDIRELCEMLDCMKSDYPVNQKLMDEICLKHLRKGKRSICFGVGQLDKVKLKMLGNQILYSFDQRPNSVIVEGDLRPYEVHQINKYQEGGGKLQVQYLRDLVAARIL